ncbi:MAG TPA: universal stress protein [Actinospica sp.]|jgi:nucleotide-binding universal stress UspA family protein|nr:universal stress protein [Actinospica sp.]
MTENYDEENPGRVVVGVDRSESSAHAAQWAAREAAARGVPLTVVHALHLPTDAALPLEPPRYAEKQREEGGKLVRLVARNLAADFPGLEIGTEVSDLTAAHTLSALGLESALVVTGTRGHGGFAGMLLGSVSRRLAAHTHCPLVVVRGQESGIALDEVVLGVEPGQHDEPIRYAFEAAQRYGAVLHAVRAWHPHATYEGPMGTNFTNLAEVRDQERRSVENLLAPFSTAYPSVKVEVTAQRGNPVPVLIETARDTRLLVVGAHRHRGPLSVGAGYVVDGLLAHSPTPVAVVPTHTR